MDKHIMSWMHMMNKHIMSIDVHLMTSTVTPATATTAYPSDGGLSATPT